MHHISVWLECQEPGCPRGTTADRGHLTNLTSPGGWTCAEHEETH